MDITKNRAFSVAPMMDCTDRHARYFMRLITRQALLYTEMVTTGAIVHGDRHHLLGYDPFEHPIALQLGGSDPNDLVICAQIGQDWGYDEINLNVGCPSDRVQSGRFGACLMAEPELVRDCVRAMRQAVSIPVTVKTRIGIDEQDSYEALSRFVDIVSEGGCDVFIFHARKAWLQGLSPKENREVPPLKYDVVYQVKRDFPHLHVSINGGIKTLDEVGKHLEVVDGVMVGREAYSNPYFMVDVDRQLFGDDRSVLSRHEVLEHYLMYVEQQLEKGRRLNQMSRHLVGLFQGQPGARAWRRYISENAHKPDADASVLRIAAAWVGNAELSVEKS
jgi:tRNA-dihydrouridine synthase A